MNIIYSTSDSFLIPTMVSINSLIKYNRVDNIFILHSDLSNISKDRLTKTFKKSKINFIECEKLIIEKLSKYNLRKVRGNWNTYLRIFIPILVSECERVLYIDSDTLIRGNISDFYNVNFNGKFFSAAIDHVAKSKYANIEDKLILNKGNYYNCGILLMNNKKLIDVDFTNQVLSYLDCSNIDFRVADQSIINYLFSKKFITSDIGFNFYSGLHYKNANATKKVFGVDYSSYLVDQNKVKIVHFVGHWFERPWFKKHFSIYSSEYKNLLKECNVKEEELTDIPTFYLHSIYDYSMYLLRINGFMTIEFYFRYIIMQTLKKFINIYR